MNILMKAILEWLNRFVVARHSFWKFQKVSILHVCYYIIQTSNFIKETFNLELKNKLLLHTLPVNFVIACRFSVQNFLKRLEFKTHSEFLPLIINSCAIFIKFSYSAKPTLTSLSTSSSPCFNSSCGRSES